MARDRSAADSFLREILAAPPAGRLEALKVVARKATIDEASKKSGGDLGTLTEGEIDRTFETAVFGATPGKVVGPFRSKFGWHVVYVSEFGQRSVGDICRTSLEQAAKSASDGDRAGIALASKPIDPTRFPEQVQRILGGGWRGPLMDTARNLVYLRNDPAPQLAPSNLRFVTKHTEFASGYLEASAMPMACARSAQEKWAVDCGAKLIGYVSLYEFEGRAGAGKRVTQISIEPSRIDLRPIAPGSIAVQYYELACTPARTRSPV
ncbi:surface-adhesin E family protein [Cupriavidus malaysiensis]|uniref:surface-adhesin E family protein n=1 Tax=Cupriavidus malaysiensis TaxID=367825 RepID=UPI003AAEB62A